MALCFILKSLEIDCTDGSIRLKPYDNSDFVGRIEVCVNGIWGSICSNYFTDNDAQVVCRQLGFTALGIIDNFN